MLNSQNPLSRMKYHGIFAKLAELPVYENSTDQLYGPDLADFYNRYVGSFAGDVPIFEQFLPNHEARVLDLACGSGRLGIGLARRGFTVDGLELSRDMLALVDRNLSGEDPAVKARLRFFQGDMTNFSLDERYDLIAIGVTSISLLLNSTLRESLFHCVRKHLKPSGKLVFDILDFSSDGWKGYDNYLDVWSSESEDGVDFAIVGQHVYPDQKVFTFNVYREHAAWDGTTSRAIGSSVKAWLTVEELAQEMQKAKLQVVKCFEVEQSTYIVAEADSSQERD